MYSRPVCCCSGVPRRSRSGPMHAHTEPQVRRFSSNCAFTWRGSMCDRSSTGISTVWKPHFLKVLNNFVLSLVNGDVKRNVLIPILIPCLPEAQEITCRCQRETNPLRHGRAVAPSTALLELIFQSPQKSTVQSVLLLSKASLWTA